MAHHGRTPQSVLDAPKLTTVLGELPECIATRTDAKGGVVAIGRRAVRAYDRAARLSQPKAEQAPRVRPERITTLDAKLARAARRELAVYRRQEQKAFNDRMKANRTALAMAGAR